MLSISISKKQKNKNKKKIPLPLLSLQNKKIPLPLFLPLLKKPLQRNLSQLPAGYGRSYPTPRVHGWTHARSNPQDLNAHESAPDPARSSPQAEERIGRAPPSEATRGS